MAWQEKWQPASGGIWIGGPAVAATADGRLDMYAVGLNSGMQHQSATKGLPGSWTGWIDRLGDDGACIGKPAADSGGGPSASVSPYFTVYTIGTLTSTLFQKDWREPGGWGSWADLGGICVGELACVGPYVFAIGTDSAVWYYDGTKWTSLGGACIGGLTAVFKFAKSVN